ncbi:MAG: VWA domain-containing protein [Candidatus Latescibacteria bacterium]|nr:VWA domain-containing protein [Candidatus Latescibacterota bacterium]
MTKISQCLLMLALALPATGGADGLLLPDNPDYPKDFLRNRLTHVTVRFNGLVAQTSVYQEFVNEWDQTTDAVYTFPLPSDARATEFIYWFQGQPYKAVLEEREQAVLSGTGEGGTAARVNRYTDRKDISIRLHNIPADEIQRVRLDYISVVDYFQGRHRYTYPLDSGDFVTRPVDHLQCTLEVQANSAITGFDLPTHPDYEVVESDGQNLKIEMRQAKAHLDQDLEFYFDTGHEAIGAEFYAAANDSTDAHFLLFVRPPNHADPATVLPKRIFFLLSNSSRMFGTRLDQSVRAISGALDKLIPQDTFTIVLFSKDITPWNDAPVPATPDNIAAAKLFLSNISTSFGSRLDAGLEACLDKIQDDSASNSIILLADGRSAIDLERIERVNAHHTGIFPIGIGEDIDRPRLEMLASGNYGFVTYLDEERPLQAQIERVFEQIRQPVLINGGIEYNRTDIRDVLPARLPSTYAGSFFHLVGRYREPGPGTISLAGFSSTGITAYNFPVNFSGQTNINPFAGQLWGKEKIDDLERRILLFGEDEGLRRQVVDLSFAYNLRSRFTAFVADYRTRYHVPTEAAEIVAEVSQATAVEEAEESSLLPQASSLQGNYPNPFNATTTLRLFIGQQAAPKTKLLKVYNALGQLVRAIDITHLRPGLHQVQLEAIDSFGRSLSSGIYFVRLQIGNDFASTIRINLIR